MSTNKETMMSKRGFVFVNFGTRFIAKLLVAVYSLRKFCNDPITVFLSDFPERDRLVEDLAKLNADYQQLDVQQPRYTTIKSLVLTQSPYEQTIGFDSDLLFRGSVEPLWAPLEEKNILLTRFHFNPYGMGGTPKRHGFGSRIQRLEDIRHMVSEEDFQNTKHRILEEEIDINIGVFGYVKGGGDALLNELIEIIARDHTPDLVDEMVTNVLASRHEHHLAEESWNCPSDERFRRTTLEAAKVLHFFADGHFATGRFLGRNPKTPEGRLWFQTLDEMNRQYAFDHWSTYDQVNEALPFKLGRAVMRRLKVTWPR